MAMMACPPSQTHTCCCAQPQNCAIAPIRGACVHPTKHLSRRSTWGCSGSCRPRCRRCVDACMDTHGTVHACRRAAALPTPLHCPLLHVPFGLSPLPQGLFSLAQAKYSMGALGQQHYYGADMRATSTVAVIGGWHEGQASEHTLCQESGARSGEGGGRGSQRDLHSRPRWADAEHGWCTRIALDPPPPHTHTHTHTRTYLPADEEDGDSLYSGFELRGAGGAPSTSGAASGHSSSGCGGAAASGGSAGGAKAAPSAAEGRVKDPITMFGALVPPALKASQASFRTGGCESGTGRAGRSGPCVCASARACLAACLPACLPAFLSACPPACLHPWNAPLLPPLTNGLRACVARAARVRPCTHSSGAGGAPGQHVAAHTAGHRGRGGGRCW
jgi:hypothetical protein